MHEDLQGQQGYPEDPIDLAVLGLDDLAYLGAEPLAELFRRGRSPRVGDLAGPMRGLMLAAPFEPSGLRRLLAGVSRSSLIPWRGKAFQGGPGGEGRGVNLLGSAQHPKKLFPFTTRLRGSRAGAFQVVELDYDLPINPLPVRRIRDELRQLNERIFLGRWYIELLGSDRFVCFFGLERRPN